MSTGRLLKQRIVYFRYKAINTIGGIVIKFKHRDNVMSIPIEIPVLYKKLWYSVLYNVT